jgi:hypothetical protein
MSLDRTRPSLATGVDATGAVADAEVDDMDATGVVLFCCRRARKSPLIRLSTRRSWGGVGVGVPDGRMMPGLSGLNLSGSGVRRRERLVLDKDRRATGSSGYGDDDEEGREAEADAGAGAFSETLLWPSFGADGVAGEAVAEDFEDGTDASVARDDDAP